MLENIFIMISYRNGSTGRIGVGRKSVGFFIRSVHTFMINVDVAAASSKHTDFQTWRERWVSRTHAIHDVCLLSDGSDRASSLPSTWPMAMSPTLFPPPYPDSWLSATSKTVGESVSRCIPVFFWQLNAHNLCTHRITNSWIHVWMADGKIEEG